MSSEVDLTKAAVSSTEDAIFCPIVDHHTMPDYRYGGWLDAAREGISLPGGRMLVTASSVDGMRRDAGCITKQAYRLGTGKIFLHWRIEPPNVETAVLGAQWGLVSPRPLEDPLGDPLVWKVWITMERAAAMPPMPLWHIAVHKDGEWEERSHYVAPRDGFFDAEVVMEHRGIQLQVNGETLPAIEHDAYPSDFRMKWGSAQSLIGRSEVTTVYHGIYLNNVPIPHKHEDLPDGPQDVRPGDDFFFSWIYQGTPEQPRSTIGDILPLGDGRLYLTYSHYYTEGAWDQSPSLIRRTISADGGCTWGEPKDLIGGDGVKALASSMIHGANGDLLMSFSTENPESIARFAEQVGQKVRVNPDIDRAQHWICRSQDQGETWDEFVCITNNDPDGPAWDGYSVSGRMLRLRSGRILQPCVLSKQLLVNCYYSDDDGRSWQRGQMSPTPDYSSADDDAIAFGLCWNCVVELRNSDLMMFIRTVTGFQYVCRSSDGGETWSQPRPSMALQSSWSPAIVRSIPATGDLLIVWNRCSTMERTSLTSAISRDDGETWENMKLIEQHRGYAYSHPSMVIDGDRVLLLYMHYAQYETLKRFDGCHDVRFASFPLDWFYRENVDKGSANA
jgi:sialidase-1